MLDVAKVPYENKMYEFEEWEKIEKPVKTFEYGFLPVLEYNNYALSQSGAITTWLGKKLGFMGSNAIEEYEILNILESNHDFFRPIGIFFWEADKLSDEEKGKKIKEFNEELIPWGCGVLERRFTNRKGKYFVGDKISVADMFISSIWQFFNHPTRKMLLEAVNKAAPKLMAFAGELCKNELKDHYETGNWMKDAIR